MATPRENPSIPSRGKYRFPGVYYEMDSRGEPTERGLTGVPIFVGMAAHDGVFSLTRWEQFFHYLPNEDATSFLSCSVHGFFQNGGQRCLVLPIQGDSALAGGLVAALQAPFESGGALEEMENIDLVCVPDAMNARLRASRAAVLDIQGAVLEHCYRMGDRFAVLDAFPVADEADDSDARADEGGVAGVVQHWEALPPRNGALYFPWVRVRPARQDTKSGVADEAARKSSQADQSLLVPPCGHVAGIYARSDRAVGVHKAPANEALEGVVDLEVHLSSVEQAALNDVGVNCLRSFPGRDIRVWGARTLSGLPNWRYVNVCRLFAALKRWLEHELRDLVFEPNSAALWDRTRSRLHAHCFELYQAGALRGRSPDEAFFVKCDAETNPSEAVQAGRVVAEVGLAPVMPAEFVIVRIIQHAHEVSVEFQNDLFS
jgi:uncharacterized protein